MALRGKDRMTAESFPEVRIGDAGGERVAIRVLGRMHPGAADSDDGNWLTTLIAVTAGQFDVTVGAALRTEEFRRLKNQLEELYSTLRGEAVFDSMENWLRLRVQAEPSGRLHIDGKLLDRAGDGNELSFTIDRLDQSYLPAIIEDLAEILSRYPVIG
jgi:hypothetical protein